MTRGRVDWERVLPWGGAGEGASRKPKKELWPGEREVQGGDSKREV